jgi:hypothetical protein
MIGFLAYLRFYKPPSEANFIIIIFRESKFVNLELTLTARFDHLKYYLLFI